MKKKKSIVVVGGGAGGLGLVRRLGSTLPKGSYDVTLVDKNLTHVWKPLLHEVAAGTLDANMDEVGYGGHGVKWGYRFFCGELEKVDRKRQVISIAPKVDERGNEIIARHEIAYDYLVLAFGGVSNTYHIPGVDDRALFLENRNNADTFRLRLLNACMRVSHQVEQGDTNEKVKVTIVGGGATGVELAAELYNAAAALKHYGLQGFDESWVKVTLLEAGPRILPALPEKIADAAKKDLEALGVSVLTNKVVSSIEDKLVNTTDAKVIASDLTLWAAGVKAPAVVKELGDFELDRLDRILVKDTLQTTIDDRIYAIGDCASFTPDGADRPLHPRAQAAQQMAVAVRKNIMAAVRGRKQKPFVYNDRGSLVSLGRYSAFGNLMGNLVGDAMAIEGRLARIAYASLYRMHIISIHGWLRGVTMILLGHVNQIIRPKVKLH